TMGLPIAWAFVELGLPAAQHDLRFALLVAVLWMAGGCLTALLTKVVGIGAVHATVRGTCADCYRGLAHYLEALRQAPDATDVVSPGTRLRAAIAEARRIAANRQPVRGATSDRLRRLLGLIEIADRLFSEAAQLRAEGRAPNPDLAEALGS